MAVGSQECLHLVVKYGTVKSVGHWYELIIKSVGFDLFQLVKVNLYVTQISAVLPGLSNQHRLAVSVTYYRGIFAGIVGVPVFLRFPGLVLLL